MVCLEDITADLTGVNRITTPQTQEPLVYDVSKSETVGLEKGPYFSIPVFEMSRGTVPSTCQCSQAGVAVVGAGHHILAPPEGAGADVPQHTLFACPPGGRL